LIEAPAPPPLRPGAVRAVVFDLDGTLVDSYRPIASSLNHARARYGLDPLPEALVRQGVGRGLESLIGHFVGPDRVEEGVRLFREHYATVFAEGTFALPGVAETLEALHRGARRISVGSNKPARFTRPILERLGLARWIEWVQGPEPGVPPKPHPAILRACLERTGATASTAVYVGDMVLDVESAARAGLPVVLVPGGSSDRESLAGTGQTVLGSIADLPRLLGLPAR
jgi:phosphoglycolate phosphatase